MESIPTRNIVRRTIYLTIAIMIMLSSYPLVSAALPTPSVAFIPSNISVNSSFLMVVDPKVTDSVRASWIAYDVGAYGQVPKIGEKWFCYFSDTDTKSTCGPSPFRISNLGYSPYTLEVNTTDPYGNAGGKTVGVYVGGIVLTSKIFKDVGKNLAYINVWANPDTVTGVSYVTYYANNLTVVPNKNGNLVYDPPSGAYRKNLTLSLGEYFIAFSAPAGSNYGGAVERVEMGVTTDGDGELGYVSIDPVKLDILINKNQKYEKSNYRITNLMNQTFGALTVYIPQTVPIDVNDFLSIDLANTTLFPYSSMYFSVVLENVINYMGIKTEAQLKSNNTLIGYIPVDIRVSVKNESGGDLLSCDDKSDGSPCYGGICCNEVCRSKANCCANSDCLSNEVCTNYKCVITNVTLPDITCTTGSCYPGYTTCPSGASSTGQSCRSSSVNGICCETVDECLNQPNGTACTSGICCSEECIYGDCCEDIDCVVPQVCSYNYCSEPPTPEFDITLPLIIVVVVIAGVGAWFFLKKRKKGGLEEEFEEGGTEEFDEEFY